MCLTEIWSGDICEDILNNVDGKSHIFSNHILHSHNMRRRVTSEDGFQCSFECTLGIQEANKPNLTGQMANAHLYASKRIMISARGN